MNRSALRSQSGFTLVEVIVTATFIAVTLAAVITIFISTGNLNRQARNLSLATQTAEQKIESYRNTSYANIAVGTEDFSAALPNSLGSPKTATADITEVESGLKRINIAISYRDGQVTKKVEMSTYITQRGINR